MLEANVNKFLDNLISQGQLPLTTHPTRILKKKATLLDIISVSSRATVYKTGIIATSIADHFPVFCIQFFN